MINQRINHNSIKHHHQTSLHQCLRATATCPCIACYLSCDPHAYLIIQNIPVHAQQLLGLHLGMESAWSRCHVVLILDILPEKLKSRHSRDV